MNAAKPSGKGIVCVYEEVDYAGTTVESKDIRRPASSELLLIGMCVREMMLCSASVPPSINNDGCCMTC